MVVSVSHDSNGNCLGCSSLRKAVDWSSGENLALASTGAGDDNTHGHHTSPWRRGVRSLPTRKPQVTIMVAGLVISMPDVVVAWGNLLRIGGGRFRGHGGRALCHHVL